MSEPHDQSHDHPDEHLHGHPGAPVPSGPLPDPEGSDDLSPTARQLRDALAARAASVRPADRLEEIRMSSRSNRRRTRAWAAVAGAAAVVVVGGSAFALTQRGDGGSVTTVASSQTTSPEPSASSAPASPPAPASTSPSAPAASASATGSATGTATGTAGTATGRGAGTAAGTPAAGAPLPSGASTVPVYWLGGEPAKLFREFVPAGDGPDDPTNALRAMLAGSPSDPDYTSPWKPDPAAAVTREGGLLVADVSAAAVAGSADVGQVDIALQQLVHTVTAAAGETLPVQLRVDGQAEGLAFGWALPASVSRAPQADVQAPAWITEVAPAAGGVTVSGVGTAFEGTLLYTITDASGAEVAREGVQAGANGTFGEFSFTAQLPAGRYTVAVLAPDESGGEGAAPVPDTKEFTVS
ncbi:Gmad2 immunoglobulin-like domain-containing protein [Kineococcus sp. SYSU DK006]|uniref:Gmad2 immunoglobulin-like domain-containing protein n=1 Tax=Kineococcus sp. SYSU DK006 TaxID=3383127 RepID=UPI003D7D2A71